MGAKRRKKKPLHFTENADQSLNPAEGPRRLSADGFRSASHINLLKAHVLREFRSAGSFLEIKRDVFFVFDLKPWEPNLKLVLGFFFKKLKLVDLGESYVGFRGSIQINVCPESSKS